MVTDAGLPLAETIYKFCEVYADVVIEHHMDCDFDADIGEKENDFKDGNLLGKGYHLVTATRN